MAYDKAQLAGLEREIVRIANVEAAAIRLDAQGAVEAVDVIADRGRSPQRIVRDVEIILRRGGLDIDHRKIGVAALDAPGAVFGGARRASAATRDRVPEPEDETEEDDVTPSPERPQVAVLEYEPDSERVRLVAVHSTTRGGNFSVEVELAVGAYEGLPGRAEGPASEPVGCAALVARATLEAVRNLLQPGYEAQLRELRIVDMSGTPLVVVTVDFGEGRRLQRVAGACLQLGSLNDTAVFATLDAINRPLGRARFRQLAVLDNADVEVQARRARA